MSDVICPVPRAYDRFYEDENGHDVIVTKCPRCGWENHYYSQARVRATVDPPPLPVQFAGRCNHPSVVRKSDEPELGL